MIHPVGQDKFDSRNLMSLNVKVLQVVGIWPDIPVPKKFEWLMKLYSFYRWLFLLMVMTNSITQIADLILSLDDLENLAANGSVTMIYLASFIKQINFFANKKRLTSLVENIQKGHFSQSLNWDTGRNQIVIRGNKKALVISWIYCVVTVVTGLSFFAFAIVNSYPEAFGLEDMLHGNETMKTLPIRASYPYDIHKPENFAITFLFQFFMLTLTPLMNCGNDTFATCLIVHGCIQFQVLKHALRNIDNRANALIGMKKDGNSQGNNRTGKPKLTKLWNCFF